MLIDWADRTDEIIDLWSGASDRRRTRLALDTIRANLAAYPRGHALDR